MLARRPLFVEEGGVRDRGVDHPLGEAPSTRPKTILGRVLRDALRGSPLLTCGVPAGRSPTGHDPRRRPGPDHARRRREQHVISVRGSQRSGRTVPRPSATACHKRPIAGPGPTLWTTAKISIAVLGLSGCQACPVDSRARRARTPCAMCESALSTPTGEHVLPAHLLREQFPRSLGPYTRRRQAGAPRMKSSTP